jgi:hypothetical protein
MSSEKGYLPIQVALEKLDKEDALSKHTKDSKLKTKVEYPKISPQAEEINKALEENK